jgi:hypothetical protein
MGGSKQSIHTKLSVPVVFAWCAVAVPTSKPKASNKMIKSEFHLSHRIICVVLYGSP